MSETTTERLCKAFHQNLVALGYPEISIRHYERQRLNGDWDQVFEISDPESGQLLAVVGLHTANASVQSYSECYVRTLRFKRVKPSVGTLAICASKLQHYGRCMTATEAHTQLGNRFIELSERCHKQINADAVGWWKDEVRV